VIAVRTYIHAYIHMHTQTFSYTCREIMLFIGKPKGRSKMISNTHVYVQTYMQKYIQTDRSTHRQIDIHTNMHTYIHTHTEAGGAGAISKNKSYKILSKRDKRVSRKSMVGDRLKEVYRWCCNSYSINRTRFSFYISLSTITWRSGNVLLLVQTKTKIGFETQIMKNGYGLPGYLPTIPTSPYIHTHIHVCIYS